jgi:putative membrane protein
MQIDRLSLTLVALATLLTPAALHAQDPGADPAAAAQTAAMTPGVPHPQRQGYSQDSASGAPMDAQSMRDKQFVRKASEGGVAESELAKLALQKTGNDGVKTFAQQIVDDHAGQDSGMKPVAVSMGIMAPKRMDKPAQSEYARLATLSGPEFDKEYILFTVQDHRKKLHEFREEWISASDPELKDAIMKSGKVIHQHLAQVEKLAKDNGIELPPRPHPAPSAQ